MSSAKDTVASSTKTILTSSANWDDWNDRFVSQAIMYDLLGHVQGKENLLPKAVKPVMEHYPQKARPTTSRSRTQPQQEHEPHSQGVSEDHTMSTGPEPREVMITFSDLTTDGQKSFSMAWTFYQDDMKAYEKQQDLVRKMKEWIAANVSSHFQKSCCKPTESLSKWYDNLKKAAGISRRLEDTFARNAYRKALNPPKLRNLLTWTDSWEQAMTEAKNKEVLATTRTSEWFEDFLVAIKGVLPSWAESYGINKDHKVEDESLDYRTVANDLRKKASEYTNATKIAKGSFGPTFADGNDHSEQGSEDKANTKRNRTHQGWQASRKRQFASDSSGKVIASGNKSGKVKTASDDSGKVCRACEGPHPTQKCYYLFPNKAPKIWTPKPHVQKLVEEALDADSTLKEEVERLKRTKRAKTKADED